jgi:hypothetical protein
MHLILPEDAPVLFIFTSLSNIHVSGFGFRPSLES